jgi:hypothetical protein
LTGGNGRDTCLLNVLDLLEYDDLPTVQDPSDVIIHIATSENNGDLTLFILIKKIIANFVACQQTISHVKHEKFGNLMTPGKLLLCSTMAATHALWLSKTTQQLL